MDLAARVPLATLSVSTLGLGCAPIGNLFGSVTDADAAATIDAAWDAGVRFFDTAPLYGHGVSERRLGDALRSRPRRDYIVATKVGRVLEAGADPDSIFADVPNVRPRFDFSSDGVKRSLGDSLERLGLDRVDIVHVHDPDDYADEALQGAFPVLCRWREEGVIGAVGAGMNQAELLTRFVREADVDCVLLAGRYSLLSFTALDELLPLCAERSVGVIVGGVFNSGVLADPAAGTYDYSAAPADVLERARRLDAVCRRHDVPLKTVAMRFPFGHRAVTSVLIGARSAAEVRENVELFGRPIPAQLWSELMQEGLLPAHVPIPA